MQEASWAAAGMLAVDDPENPIELLELSRFSRRLYAGFLARVEALSGLRVLLRTQKTRQYRVDGNMRELKEASLDPRDLCAALPRAVTASGAVIRTQCATRAVAYSSHSAQIELETGETVTADACLVAGGAWSSQVNLSERGVPRLPVVPRKGQMIEVTLPEPELTEVLRTSELYLVPRGRGRIVVGATVEDMGFDRTVDVQAGDRLWAEAGRLWPPILRGQITARWTGLRPGVLEQDSGPPLPIIGMLSTGIFVATGHFRNGILLAPGTARSVRALICGERPPVALNSFSPARFLGHNTTSSEAFHI